MLLVLKAARDMLLFYSKWVCNLFIWDIFTVFNFSDTSHRTIISVLWTKLNELRSYVSSLHSCTYVHCTCMESLHLWDTMCHIIYKMIKHLIEFKNSFKCLRIMSCERIRHCSWFNRNLHLLFISIKTPEFCFCC